MAYPTVDKPYGFKPVNLLGGQVYAGSTRQIPIESGWGTAIFFGDVVLMSASGCVVGGGTTVNTSAAVQVAGVFMGCNYINSLGQRIYAQYYPAGTTGTVDTSGGIYAVVADDPDLVMKVAIVSGTTVVAQAARSSLVGGTVALVNNIGSTVTGDSQQAVLNASGTTTTAPFKIIDVVPDTSPAVGSFVEVLVTWTQGVHMYRGAAGI
jgi:hypothetical protein